jgi:hypothetical protein
MASTLNTIKKKEEKQTKVSTEAELAQKELDVKELTDADRADANRQSVFIDPTVKSVSVEDLERAKQNIFRVNRDVFRKDIDVQKILSKGDGYKKDASRAQGFKSQLDSVIGKMGAGASVVYKDKDGQERVLSNERYTGDFVALMKGLFLIVQKPESWMPPQASHNVPRMQSYSKPVSHALTEYMRTVLMETRMTSNAPPRTGHPLEVLSEGIRCMQTPESWIPREHAKIIPQIKSMSQPIIDTLNSYGRAVQLILNAGR